MCPTHVLEDMVGEHDFRHVAVPACAGRLPPSMKMNRLSSIGLAACAALVATMIAMTLVSSGFDGHWQTLLGVLVNRVAAAVTPPPSWNSAGSERLLLSIRLYIVGYVACCLLFTALFWLCTRAAPRRPAWIGALPLAVQLVIGIAVESNLLYMLAAEVAIVSTRRAAIGWLAAMVLGNLTQSLVIWRSLSTPDQLARFGLLQVGMETVFYLFAFGVAKLAVAEQQARARLAASHAELQATQALLADTVRASERLRIARDLHDSVGHHLTALNLHLELADRQLGQFDNVNDAVRTARTLSCDLLAEVRAVVSAERGDQAIDLRQSLKALCDGIPTPTIRLEVADGVHITSAFAAHALFRCIQEAVSNTLRHAEASRLTVALVQRDARVTATIRDDGRGARGRPEGNGLTGMRERLQALGGTLEAGDLPTGGFQVALSLPAPEGAA